VAALAPDILSRARISASSFVAALEEGQQEFASLQQAEDRQKGEQSKDFVGGVIYISDARKAGIMPLPYDFKNQSSDSKAP
jgi:hypothetical protein